MLQDDEWPNCEESLNTNRVCDAVMFPIEI